MKIIVIIAIAFALIFVMTSAERVFGYADDEVEIIVSVDKSSYKVGDLLTIKGTGAHSYSIFVDIISPNGDQIADLKFIAAKNGDFSSVWIIPRGLDDGTYTIHVRDVKKQTQTTFNIQSVTITQQSEPNNSTSSKIPHWVENIFAWYEEGEISEDEMRNAIEWLMNQGILKEDYLEKEIYSFTTRPT